MTGWRTLRPLMLVLPLTVAACNRTDVALTSEAHAAQTLSQQAAPLYMGDKGESWEGMGDCTARTSAKQSPIRLVDTDVNGRQPNYPRCKASVKLKWPAQSGKFIPKAVPLKTVKWMLSPDDKEKHVVLRGSKPYYLQQRAHPRQPNASRHHPRRLPRL